MRRTKLEEERSPHSFEFQIIDSRSNVLTGMHSVLFFVVVHGMCVCVCVCYIVIVALSFLHQTIKVDDSVIYVVVVVVVCSSTKSSFIYVSSSVLGSWIYWTQQWLHEATSNKSNNPALKKKRI